MMITKELTTEERMTWGECPVCHAKHGENCDPGMGLQLGLGIGPINPEGAHLGRLNNAPFKVELRPVAFAR